MNIRQDVTVAGVESDPDTLTLHAVRLLGYADTRLVARRFGLDIADTTERLLDLEATGRVTRSEFGGSSGWSLTECGRVEGERRLALELDDAKRVAVAGVHEAFRPVNTRLQEAVTRWQLRPIPGEPLTANDHADHRWDDRVLEELGLVGRQLTRLQAELTLVLPRFDGYAVRFGSALDRAVRGAGRWVDGVGIDSCHVVWMQLHEDLLATLGIGRGRQS